LLTLSDLSPAHPELRRRVRHLSQIKFQLFLTFFFTFCFFHYRLLFFCLFFYNFFLN